MSRKPRAFEPFDVVLGIAIAERRKARGWDQTELGRNVGLTQAQISLIENGRQPLEMRKLRQIVRAFGVSPGKFLQSIEEKAAL